MYGYDKIDFIADSTTEKDIGGLVKLVSSVGVNAKKSQRNNSIEFRLDRLNEWAGRILLSSDIDEVGSGIKVAMLPYKILLSQPKYLVAEIKDRNAITKVLESYSFPVIITPDATQLKALKEKFPVYVTKYGTRIQSQSEIQASLRIIKEIVPELNF